VAKKKVAVYLRKQAAVRAPDDPEDTLGLAKDLVDSLNLVLTTDEEYTNWWSGVDSGTIIDVDEDAHGESSYLFSPSFYDEEDDRDDGDNGGDNYLALD
jgi:hypothetical protein